MRSVRRVMAGILALGLIPLLCLLLIMQAADATLLSPAYWQRGLQEAGIYSALARTLATEARVQITAGLGTELLDEELAVAALGRLVTGERLQAMAEPLIPELVGWVRGDVARPDLRLDLAWLRAQLPGALRAAMQQQLDRLPACTPAEAADMLRQWQQQGPAAPACRPPDAAPLLAAMEQVGADPELWRGLGGAVDLTAAVERDQGPGVWVDLPPPLALLRSAATNLPRARVAVAIVVVLLAAVTLERWYAPLGWIGWPVLIAGAGTAALTWAAGALLAQGIASAAPGPPAELVAAAGAVIDRAVALLLRYALAAAGLGAACLLALAVAPKPPAAGAAPLGADG